MAGGAENKTNDATHTKRAPKLPSSPQEMKREGREGSPLRFCTIYLEPRADGNAGFTRHTHPPTALQECLKLQLPFSSVLISDEAGEPLE